jgi:hypothetical protein
MGANHSVADPRPPTAIAAHLPVLRSGLRWLYDTEQPPTAIAQHHGERLLSVGNRSIKFVPCGWGGRVVIVLDVANVEYGGNYEPPCNPLAHRELDNFKALLAEMGPTVAHAWNGHPAITGSVALSRPAHPTLIAAVDRYYAGCPDHGRSVFCGCGWFSRGNTTLTRLRTVHEQEPAGG